MTHEAGPFRDTFTPDSTPAWQCPHGTPYSRLCSRRVAKPDLPALSALAKTIANGASPGANSTIPAGFTYWGQFLAHDLTLAMPGASSHDTDARNGRSGRLDLECLLGHGPRADSHLYDRVGAPTLALEVRGNDVDVPRRGDGVAVIADGRNDDNVLVGQIHIGLAMAYNRLAEEAFAKTTERQSAYSLARRALTRAYQYVTLTDYLARILHKTADARRQALVEKVSSHQARCPLREAALPVEFAFATMRFGHSMARNEYSLNDHLSAPVPLFPRRSTSPSDSHLRGGSPLPPLWSVDWRYFFDDLDDSQARCQMSSPIDTSVTPAMGAVQMNAAKTVNLAEITLMSEVAFGVPTAKQVIRDLNLALPVPEGGDASLWWSILDEAGAEAAGGLGPTGSALVMEGFEVAFAGITWPQDMSNGVSLLGTPIGSVSELLRWGQHRLPRGGRTAKTEGGSGREAVE